MRTGHLRLGFRSVLTFGGIAAVLTASRASFAVDCPTPQTIPAPAGATNFGQTVGMYVDGITGEYLVVGASNATYVYMKPVGSTAQFSTTPSQIINVGGTSLAVAENGTIVIGSGFGSVSIFQQTQTSNGPAGLPFNPAGTITLLSLHGLSSFGRSVSYEWVSNVLTACDDTHCYAYAREGSAGWTALGSSSAFSNVNSESVFDVSAGNGYLLTQNDSSPFLLNFYTYGSVNSLTSFSPVFQWQVSPTSSGLTFASYSPEVDRFYVAQQGAGAPGTVQTMSNDYLYGGAIGVWTNPPWHAWPSLQLTDPNASPSFGASVTAQSDSVFVIDPGAAGGTRLYQYQIVHTPPGNFNLSTDSVMEVVPGGTPVFGTATAVNVGCGVVGEPSTSTVSLFSVTSSLPTECCAGVNGMTVTCSMQMGASCPSSSSKVTVQIPTAGGANSATITEDDKCTDWTNGIVDNTVSVCATVSLTGKLLGPAEICFPYDGDPNPIIQRCDPLSGPCTGKEATVEMNAQGSQFCCVPLPTGAPIAKVVGNEFCTQTTGFSTFLSGSKGTNFIDTDGDTVPDLMDNCPFVANAFQQDQDGDLIGDVCDNCPTVPNQDQNPAACAIVGSLESAGAVACNGPTGTPAQLVYNDSAFGFTSWRDVLALVYGGQDNSAGTVDCGSAKRATVVNNWSNLFESACTNSEPTCNDTTHAGALWHAFRPDDGSSVAQTFAALIGLSPSSSATAVNGFGTSPYCNAMNWDQAEVTAGGCANTAPNHYVGPGGVVGPDGKHHLPPPGTYGSVATGSQPFVFPTSFQDNDPIRRTCIGSGSAGRAAEDVCNTDGNLGLVLSSPALDFIPTEKPGLVSYPSSVQCTGGVSSGAAPKVLSCAPRGHGVFFGVSQCPNGDSPFAFGCLIPVGPGASGPTSQCIAIKSEFPTLCNVGPCSSEGRIYNEQVYDGTAAGSIAYLNVTEPVGTFTQTISHTGGYARIHMRETIPTGLAACQNGAADLQIGCLVEADRCSLGLGDNAAKSADNVFLGINPP